MSDIIERNNADNLRRMRLWLRKCFIEDFKYPDVFIQEMNVIIAAAKELKKEAKERQVKGQ